MFWIECIFCGRKIFLVNVHYNSGCSRERRWTSASQFELFFDIQSLYLFFHIGVTSGTSRQQPAVTHNTVHVVDAVNGHFGRITGDKWEGGGSVFYRTVVFFSFTTFVCFGVLISACSPGDFF